MDDTRVHRYWLEGDRQGYIAEARRVLKLARGGTVTANVASRWFNLNNVLHETTGDVWVHREKDELWWTLSQDIVPEHEIRKDPRPTHGSDEIYLYFKTCSGWTNRDKRGEKLNWNALHPKAKEFLFTEGTYQSLSPENAAYAEILLEGGDLKKWHDQKTWREKQIRSRHGAVVSADAWKRTAYRMAENAINATIASGKISTTLAKQKPLDFASKDAFVQFVEGLLHDSERLCALTDLPLLLDGEDGDREFAASLDRIDSARGYEPENLQVVCWFANRWKCDSNDAKFRELIATVKGQPLSEGSSVLHL